LAGAPALSPHPWRAGADALLITVRVTPRGSRDAIEGVETLADGRAVLKLRVRAAPSDGAANAALIACLADALDLPKSAVSIASGASARIKTVRAAGDAASLARRLEALLAGA
jgi:uncharacterized protein (TIGR00251 family)